MYCQVSPPPSELPLLLSLSAVLPIAAVLVTIVTIIFIARRLRAPRNVANSRERRARFVMSTLSCSPFEAVTSHIDRLQA